jgi:hypothetical protein
MAKLPAELVVHADADQTFCETNRAVRDRWVIETAQCPWGTANLAEIDIKILDLGTDRVSKKILDPAARRPTERAPRIQSDTIGVRKSNVAGGAACGRVK